MTKKLALFILLAIITMQMRGQLSAVGSDSDEYLKFKASKTLAVKSGDKEYDKMLEEGMKNSWTITPYELISADKMKEKISDKSFSFILPITSDYGNSLKEYKCGFIVLIMGGRKNLSKYAITDFLAYNPCNYCDEKEVTDCSFRLTNIIASMQETIFIVEMKRFRVSDEADLAVNLMQYYRTKSGSIKERTLLICKESIGHKLDESDIASIYPYKFELCSKEKLADVIKEKNAQYYYLQPGISFCKNYFVVDPASGEIVYGEREIMGQNINKHNIEGIVKAVKRKN